MYWWWSIDRTIYSNHAILYSIVQWTSNVSIKSASFNRFSILMTLSFRLRELEFELISFSKQTKTCKNSVWLFSIGMHTMKVKTHIPIQLVRLEKPSNIIIILWNIMLPVINRTTWRYSHDKYRNWWFSSISIGLLGNLDYLFVLLLKLAQFIKQLKLLFDIGYRKLMVFMLLR